MRIVAISILVVSLFAKTATATPVDMTVDRLFDICKASTVKDASIKVEKLGWLRMTDEDLSKWQAAYVGYNGGSVEVIGWKRETSDGSDSQSFWIAVGPNSHQACTYSTNRPACLVEALTGQLGYPDNFVKVDMIESTTAFWKKGDIEYALSQIGSSAMFQISKDR